MQRDGYPLPRIYEIFDDIKDSTVFSMLDIFQGYWQIKMDESCKQKTAFICRQGTFLFKVIPFGLLNAQATFQKKMDQLFSGISFLKCYVDDVVVHSRERIDYISHLAKDFEVLERNGLRCGSKNVSSCSPASSCLEIK